MKQLTMFVALNTDGGDRITFYYDLIDDETGDILKPQEKEHFFVLNDGLRKNINEVREYIRKRLSDPLYQLTSFMAVHVDGTDRIGFTYDKISQEGEIISTGNKDGFVVLDDALRTSIDAIRDWLKENKLSK